MKELKVAIVHDWLTSYRGSEKVLECLCKMFPEAPLYTLVYTPGTSNNLIEKRKIYTSFINKLPCAETKVLNYFPLFPLAAKTLGVKGYDLIISTSHSVAKSVNTYGAKHWCYIHSPMRSIWDMFDDYYGIDKVGKFSSKYIYSQITKALRKYDVKTAARVDHFVANSTFVQKRVKDYYNMDSELIYPPVDIARFERIQRRPGDFYLFFSELTSYKKADHAIMACNQLKKKLIVLGRGSELQNLKKIADPEYITFISEVSQGTVNDLYSRAKALLFPGVEDFGIIPVEASASGLPVIGFKKGGLLDSQTNKTCVFYDEQTVDALCLAIEKFEKDPAKYDPVVLKQQAKQFSKNIFEEKINNSINHFIEKHVVKTNV